MSLGRWIIVAAAAVALSGQPSEQPCREHPKVKAGSCFWFKGRAGIYNGAPVVRLWRVGTPRILGVSGGMALPGYASVPKSLTDALAGSLDRYVFGEFEFCPYVTDRPGVMRLGCVNGARRLIVKSVR